MPFAAASTWRERDRTRPSLTSNSPAKSTSHRSSTTTGVGSSPWCTRTIRSRMPEPMLRWRNATVSASARPAGETTLPRNVAAKGSVTSTVSGSSRSPFTRSSQRDRIRVSRKNSPCTKSGERSPVRPERQNVRPSTRVTTPPRCACDGTGVLPSNGDGPGAVADGAVPVDRSRAIVSSIPRRNARRLAQNPAQAIAVGVPDRHVRDATTWVRATGRRAPRGHRTSRGRRGRSRSAERVMVDPARMGGLSTGVRLLVDVVAAVLAGWGSTRREPLCPPRRVERFRDRGRGRRLTACRMSPCGRYGTW